MLWSYFYITGLWLQQFIKHDVWLLMASGEIRNRRFSPTMSPFSNYKDLVRNIVIMKLADVLNHVMSPVSCFTPGKLRVL